MTIVAGARIEHAQQVGEGRHAADRRSGGRRAPLLLQRNRRREPLYEIDLRDFHLVEQAARVWRDGFQVAALGFRIEGGEGERRLAGPRHAGEHDQRVARDVDIDVLEIVLSRATNADEAGRLELSHAKILTFC
jgi:hypothetical protein